MELIGGALPNVMFLVGVMAVGIGLGIQWKIIEIKADLGRTGRIAAFAMGSVLIGLSIMLYLQPAPQASSSELLAGVALASSTTPAEPERASESAQASILEVSNAVSEAADEEDLDAGVARKLDELLASLGHQLAKGDDQKAAQTHEELVATMSDAIEDEKLSPDVGLDLLELARDIPLP